jgi:glycosyltransferase involved in cell wall biosynthesis
MLTETGKKKTVLFSWGVSSYFGWGVYGVNLILNWSLRGDIDVSSIWPIKLEQVAVNPIEMQLFEPAAKRSEEVYQYIRSTTEPVVKLNHPLLAALGNDLVNWLEDPALPEITGSPNIGVIFSENTHFSNTACERANKYSLIIAGSNWNRDVLVANGIDHVTVVLQGVDTTYFHPAPKLGLFQNRFVVFSGGKVEYRKGQDLVVQAFKIFAERHPDALLLTAWNSPHPDSAKTLNENSPIHPLQFEADGFPDLLRWTTENGIPEQKVIHLGTISQMHMPRIVRETDVALFPNRAEGGTNLVAMECMACGIPVILSANTGHLDLIQERNCYPLETQGRIEKIGFDGWGESNIEEIVANLEAVYANRQEAAARAQRGAALLSGMSWKTQLNRLALTLRPYMNGFLG